MTRTTESLRHVCYLFAPVHTNGTLVIIVSKGRLYSLHKTGPQRCLGAVQSPAHNSHQAMHWPCSIMLDWRLLCCRLCSTDSCCAARFVTLMIHYLDNLSWLFITLLIHYLADSLSWWFVILIRYLDVNEKSLQSPERVVHSEVIAKLGHQQKFKGQDGVSKLLTVALQVADKLTNGNVELFHLARQVHNCQPEGRHRQ